MTLRELGWTDHFEAIWTESFEGSSLEAGRVAGTHRGFYTLWTESGSLEAPARGKLVRSADAKPVTGDWVALDRSGPTVRELLPRQTQVVRKAPGEPTEAQILGANIDTIFVVAGLDRDFNLRRIERFLLIAFESGAQPVVVLNKADVCPNADELKAQVEVLSQGAPVLLTSAEVGEVATALGPHLSRGKTAGFVGSSGVGKSTLINRLLDSDERATSTVRASDGRGRHTTVGRDLLRAPDGWFLMDLPGVRAVEPWSDGGFEQTFADVEELIRNCRFTDCSHSSEPGCQVREALSDGALDSSRWENYLKVRADLERLEQRRMQRESSEGKRAPSRPVRRGKRR